ncbi:cytoskeleton-associated protein 5-A-like isoform X2 [Mya arenaria]|uniref:cytoskeleton-associated protein 5-A-like isoform X2 n=1 Tax=Mya arenaria TaxID=6604 RepID=UPI0022E00651|nr:cytoskeleton-associated protein 5-A-like isoform X2 [Mya arenaria]
MGDDSEWMKLPTDEKVQHKVWKARLAGYEEAIKLFKSIDDEKSPEFSKFAPFVRKFVVDSNAVAQEKAMEATVVYVEKAAVATKVAHEVTQGIVTKCLSASKQKTKEYGKEIIMLYIEAEKQDVVSEVVIEGWTNKNPKVVAASVQVMKEALRDFGNKIVQIKPMVKFLPKLLEDRDKNVRDEAKGLVVEMYRWVGAAIKPKLVDFKPVQVAELEAEFEKLAGEKPHQARFLRSQQDLKAKMEEKAAMAEAGVDEEEEDEEAGEDVDPYDLLEPVNILAALPKDYYDKIEAKKWQERREALEAVQKLCENPKIEPGDHGALVKTLMKVVGKDSNVMLVVLGGKCLASLAMGLRNKFSPYAAQCIQVYIEKFKEKKPMVVTALRDAIDAAYLSISLEPLIEDLVAALENKNPSIKAETALFLARAFSRLTLSSLPKKQLKVFCAGLLKTINDTVPDVREASYQALGTAMKVVTEKNIMIYMADTDSIKMQKIKDCCEKAVLLNAKGEPRAGGAAKPKPQGSEPKPVTRPGAPPPVARPKTAPGKASTGGPPKTKRPGTAKPRVAGKKSGPKKPAGQPAEERTEKILSDEAIAEKAAEFIGAEVLAQLEQANWKERLAGTETLVTNLRRMTRDMIPCQVCIRTIIKKPGIKDNNFQVLKLKVELVAYLAKNADFTRVSADYCLPDLVEKVGDVKNGAGVQEALSCIAEACGLDYVAGTVMKLAFGQKNPKNQSEALNWLTKAITEFGLKVQIKQHIQNIKTAFAATNPAIRQSALSLLPVLYLHMGQQLRMFFEDEKPALLQQIDAEFEKVKGQKPPAPVRGMKPTDDEDEEDEADGGRDEEDSPVDLIPRNDVGDRFSGDLIESLSDKNWKVRGEGLQKIIAILNEAKFITGNLGSLPEAIKTRLGDANKILVTTTIGICVTLATNLGPHCKAHVKVIGPALISCLADMKPALRSTALGALNAWVDNTTLTPLVECEALSDALKLENPNLRQELLGWLTERLPAHKPLPRDEMRLCVPHLLSCLEDRNAEVRKKAQEALVPFMIHTGYESVFKATNKLKPASKDQIMQIIEKAKDNLPAKQPKKKAAPAKSSAAPPPVDDYDEEPARSAPPTKEKSPSAEPPEKVPAKGAKKTKGKAAPASSSRKKVEEDVGPPLTVNEPKEKRFKDEKNMKCLKWNFKDPKPEYVEQLRTQMERNFSKTMIDILFHTDFKSHTKAIETLLKCVESLHEEQLANLDLILKWFSLRFFDTNPSMLNKALDYLQQLFKLLSDADYQLHEYEANSFIPYLVIKVGENKDNVRRDVRGIFKQLYHIYPASKMYVFIADGVKSKNSKTRTECLEELGYLIETYGISICQPTPQVALKQVAGQIGDQDNKVRNAALNTTVIAHQILGDNLFKYIGTLRDKDQSYLDERIKRTKSKPAPAAGRSQSRERPKSVPNAPPQSQRANSQPEIQRPGTGIPKSQSSSAVPREYRIEIQDDSNKENFQMPKLYQCDGLDDILQDVQMPVLKARPPSPGPKFLSNADTSSTVSFVISQITNRDMSVCIQALAQIDEVFKDSDKVSVMEDHVEQLLVAMSMQFKMAYSTHMGDDETPKDEVIRLYRCLFGTLVALFQNSVLACHASKEILKELMYNLLTLLLDQRLNDLEEGPQVVRSVNVLVVKIVERSDQTNVLCALIRLIQECVDSQTCSNKFIELIMKCLWKMVRMLPDTIKELNLDRVLYDLHVFLRAFPSSTWKERANDLPLRTIKTILHSLVKLKGSKILQHLGQIDASEASEVKIYIQRLLQKEGHNLDAEVNGTNDENKTPRSTSKSKRLSKSTHDMLTEIFKKVGSKEYTKEGLRDLYEFKKKYPEADMDPFLKKTSQYFQNYIERGLHALEMEETQGGESQVDAGRPASDRYLQRATQLRENLGQDSNKQISNVPVEDANAAPYFREKLRMLRAQCGLDPNTASKESSTEMISALTQEPEISPRDSSLEEGRDSVSDDISSSKDFSGDGPASKSAAKFTDVESLKARLERIKQMANS